MKKNYNVDEIVSNFTFKGEYLRYEPYGNGHINDTYAVYFRKQDGIEHRYILQRINHFVFIHPDELMQNIEGVTSHLKTKIVEIDGDVDRETLNLIPTKDNNSYYKSDDGLFFRAYKFIEDAKTYDLVENDVHFYNAGKAFGRFQRRLHDYDASSLYETIVNFHNTPKRYKDFLQAVEEDKAGRCDSVQAEIEFVKSREKDANLVYDMLQEGTLPTRVTHNDTKFNNIMIDDESGEGICVIDLDTVMPGTLLYDFGDSIRFGASTALEDEKDLDKVWMDLNLFDKFTEGFLLNTKDIMNKNEIDYLPFSAKLMTLECGMRFLADHLNGDEYFKVHRDGHNLDRARTQFKLVSDMEDKMGDMRSIVEKYI